VVVVVVVVVEAEAIVAVDEEATWVSWMFLVGMMDGREEEGGTRGKKNGLSVGGSSLTELS
jgi:hypothetical protein